MKVLTIIRSFVREKIQRNCKLCPLYKQIREDVLREQAEIRLQRLKEIRESMDKEFG